jgi:hypothetical protein
MEDDMSGSTITGRSVEAYVAERDEEERKGVELYARLQRLNELAVDFAKIRAEHERLSKAINDFGATLGLLDELEKPIGS